MAARCTRGDASTATCAPFQPFVEIIRQLIADLRLQERREAAPADLDLTGTHAAGQPVESWARLLAVVNDYSGELLRIAPDLRKYLPGEAYQQVDFGREADYIFRALSAFFIELATLQPICLSFEDLQWADKSTLDLLRHLAAALDAARRAGSEGSIAAPRLTLVASARTGYPQLDDLLTQLRERHQAMELQLVPLAAREARELIALRLNCRPEELSDDLVGRVHELCGGNPFFVSETVREWFEKDAIARGDSGWVLATEAADSTDLPETVREAMRLRLQGLPARAQEVLGAAAVIGAVVDIDLLREVLPEHTEGDVLDAIDALLPRRVFRETGNAGRVQFVHDLLRELPYGDLSATRRRSLHRRVGERLEDRRRRGQSVAPAVLADHFKNAEDRPRAFAYSMEAAQAALDAYAFNNAIIHLNDALAFCPEVADDAARYRAWDLLGIAHGSSGRLDSAISAYTKALEFAGDGIARARAHHGIGEAYQRKSAVRRRDPPLQPGLAGGRIPAAPEPPGTPLRPLADLRLLPHAPGLATSTPRRPRPRPADRDGVRDLLSPDLDRCVAQPPQLYSGLLQGRRPREAVGKARAIRRRLFQVRPQPGHVLAASARGRLHPSWREGRRVVPAGGGQGPGKGARRHGVVHERPA